MKITKLLILIIFSLLGVEGFAQNYQWQWAKAGGGNKVTYGLGGNYSPTEYLEEVVSLKNTSDNNTFLLSHIKPGNTNFGGLPITTYSGGVSTSGTNIFLAKVDCEGNYLWHKTFGSASSNAARSMEIDSLDNVYVSMYVHNTGMEPSYDANSNIFQLPFHFDTDTIMNPVPRTPGNGIINPNFQSPAHKRLALIKYNSSGEFQWLRMPQSDLVTYRTNIAVDYGMYVESDGTIHWMVGLGTGNHLNGQLQVSVSQLNPSVKYYILKYDSNGNFLEYLALPFDTQDTMDFPSKSSNFTYDPLVQQYYFTTFPTDEASLISRMFIGEQEYANAVLVCMDATAQVLWIKESNNKLSTLINDIITDSDSNVYISGIGTRSTLLPNGVFGPENGHFAGYQFTTSSARKAFVIKLDSSGNLVWGSNAGIPVYESRRTEFAPGMVLNGDEIAVATGFYNQKWGEYGITGQLQQGGGYEAILIRLNSNTGVSIGAHRIFGHIGFNDALTAVEVDKDGNYIVGGYMRSYIFATNTYVDPIVGMLPLAAPGGDTDFFIAKLAKTVCNTASTDDFSTLSLKIYPNPTTNSVFIDTQENLTTYEVYNILGQRLLSNSFNGNNAISLEAFAPGTYFIQVTTQQNTQATVKVIKQ